MIWHKKYILISAILLAIGAATFGVWFFVLKPTSDSANIQQDVLEAGEGKTYSELTNAERDARAKKETGYTTKELEEKTLDATVLPDADKAYSAAQLLASAGSYKKSLEAYKIAEPKKDSQDFYNQYIETAILANDQNLATTLMKKQLEILKSEDPKDEVAITRLEDMIADREANL